MPTPISYLLAAPPLPPPPPPPTVPLLAQPGAPPGPTDPPFWGSGILRPFTLDQKNDIAHAAGLPLIQACVGQVLGTRAANASGTYAGEVLWRQAFGSQFYYLKHMAANGTLPDVANYYAINALARWEPRVTNIRCSSAFNPGTYTLTINLVYDVISANVPGNQVIYPNVAQTVTVQLAA